MGIRKRYSISSGITDKEKNKDQCNENDDESISNRESEGISDNNDENFINYQDNYDSDGNDANINEIDGSNNENRTQISMLYENSTLTPDECVFNLLNFYIKHNITKSAVGDMLKMQLKFPPDHNKMPKT